MMKAHFLVLSGLQMAILLSLHMEGREIISLQSVFMRAPILILKAPPSGPNYLPKVQPPNTTTLEITALQMNLDGRRQKHSVNRSHPQSFTLSKTAQKPSEQSNDTLPRLPILYLSNPPTCIHLHCHYGFQVIIYSWTTVKISLLGSPANRNSLQSHYSPVGREIF